MLRSPGERGERGLAIFLESLKLPAAVGMKVRDVSQSLREGSGRREWGEGVGGESGRREWGKGVGGGDYQSGSLWSSSFLLEKKNRVSPPPIF